MGNILVVDDYSDTAKSTALLLEQLGHSVQIARNGYQAIEIARRQRPNFVLLDLGLPGLDGYQVAVMLRQELPGPLVIIAVTGFADEECRRRALAAGCDHHFPKPIDPGALVTLFSTMDAMPDGCDQDSSAPEARHGAVDRPITVNRQVGIVNTHGFTLRAADKFVRLARRFQADVRIAYGGRTASGLSVLDLTSLHAARGARLELAADGPEAEAALTALVDLIARRFDEQE
jgi:phosphotransferase system HPr (HPr) family protein